MKTPDRKMLTLIAAVIAVFLGLTAGISMLGHVGLMPQFDRVSGSLFIALFWVLILIVLPVSFAKGLSWMARSRRKDNSHFDLRDIPKDGPLSSSRDYVIDEEDKMGGDTRLSGNGANG